MTQSSSQASAALPSSFIQPVVDYFHSCQKNIVTSLSMIDGFPMHENFNPSGVTYSIENGRIFERAGLSFFYTQNSAIPANMLTPSRQNLVGSPFEQTGIILALHPKNPYIPSVSMHLHCTILFPKQQQPIGWFSVSMDLTPFYGFEEDAIHFHQVCKTLLDAFGRYRYPLYKSACDQHFFLEHRKEPRGIGGIFYDDIHDTDFETQFEMTKAVGNHLLEAYIPIVEKRKIKPYTERERAFQAYRRGRYVIVVSDGV
jgi:coproporphyrinogen III oxidase